MSKQKRSPKPIIVFLVKAGDFVILNLLLLLVYHVSYDYLTNDIAALVKEIWLIANLCYGISVSFFGVRLTERVVALEAIVRNALYIAGTFFVLANNCFVFLNIIGLSRMIILLFSALLCLFIIGWRVTCRLMLKNYRKKGKNFINVVIVGAGKIAEQLYGEMKMETSAGFNVLGFFDNNKTSSDVIPNYLGILQDLPAYKENIINEIYYTLPITTGQSFNPIVRFARMNMINFFFVPDFRRVLKRKIDMSFLENTPLFKISTEPLAERGNQIIKRVLDIVFSILVIIFTYPLLYLFIAPLIKLSSPGPILFKQERTGLMGGSFICYKFRSMAMNGDADKKQATKGDNRITKIGAFLRKTNLDEMPQFINVLKGEMSVVGPRPHMTAHTEEYSRLISQYMFRHIVKPGITGLAQVSGFRGETKDLKRMEGRIERDVWYIENWSVLLDIKIIFRTIINLFTGDEMAY